MEKTPQDANEAIKFLLGLGAIYPHWSNAANEAIATITDLKEKLAEAIRAGSGLSAFPSA